MELPTDVKAEIVKRTMDSVLLDLERARMEREDYRQGNAPYIWGTWREFLGRVERSRGEDIDTLVQYDKALQDIKSLYESLYESQGAFPNAIDLNRFYIAVRNEVREALDLPRDRHPQYKEIRNALTDLHERVRAGVRVPREE